ncbi:hypothetical protein CapIbe_011952 [Capra ibex]
MEEAKILRLSGKPQNAPEGYQNRLKVLYSQKATPGSSRKTCRYIPSLPDRILDAPEIRNDYYLNLVDWSPGNVLAVALDNSVCSILWSPHYKELISGHGFAQNQLVIWKYPTMAKVAELKGHTARVLLTMSPDGATVASAAADETLRLWRCFELDPARQQEREASVAKSSLIHQGIR